MPRLYFLAVSKRAAQAARGLVILVVFVVALPLKGFACDALPTNLSREITRRYPSWAVAQLSDLGADDQQLFLAAHGAGACPGIARGRFVGTNDRAYAILLRKGGNGRLHEMVLVAQPSKGDFELRVALADTPTSRPAVIVSVPPGQYSAVGNEAKVRLTFEGIRYEVIEAGASLIYWDKDRFAHVVIGE